jgi:hypothetical protein
VDGRKNFVGPRDLGALLELARSEQEVQVYGEVKDGAAQAQTQMAEKTA